MKQSTFLPDEAAMRALAFEIGQELQAGDLVALSGPLGAGKTTFVQEIARALDVEEAVTSPTFVLMLEYVGRAPLLHCDAYRLEELSPEELEDAGVGEFLSRTDAVRVLEWPEMIAPVVRFSPTVTITLSFEDNGRRVSIRKSA